MRFKQVPLGYLNRERDLKTLDAAHAYRQTVARAVPPLQIGRRARLVDRPPDESGRQAVGYHTRTVYQLIREGKLDAVMVIDERTKVRIAYMITLQSLEERRRIKRNSGQWQPREIV
jgi:TFIIF-interacting CTD phosphatase-like protein